MAAAVGEEEFTEAELEVAAILCDLKRVLRARGRRRRRPEIPSWGRRRLRSVLEDAKPTAAEGVAAKRDDHAASPDTPLAFPETDAAPPPEDDANQARAHAEEQQCAVASLSQEKAHLLEHIEEYRARLQRSTSTNDSLKQQMHKVMQQQQEEQARKLRPALDLNEPARAPTAEEAAAMAAAAAEWYRHGRLRAAQHRAAVSAQARRRRLDILRAKVKAASPLPPSSRRRIARLS